MSVQYSFTVTQEDMVAAGEIMVQKAADDPVLKDLSIDDFMRLSLMLTESIAEAVTLREGRIRKDVRFKN